MKRFIGAGLTPKQIAVEVAVAEKVGTVETAAAFFQQRAGKATGAGLAKFLRTAPKARRSSEDVIA